MLKALHADGYRLLNQFHADFGLLTVVVGANACGKSTVLDCLTFFSQMASGSPDPIRSHGGIGSVVSACTKDRKVNLGLSLDRTHGHFWRQIPIPDAMDYGVLLVEGPDGRAQVVGEELHGGIDDGHEKQVLLTNSKSGFFVFDHDAKKLVPFDQPSAGLPSLPSEADLPPADSEEMPARPVFRLPLMAFPKKFPVLYSVREAIGRFRVYASFDVSATSPLRTQNSEIRPETVLLPNAANLGSVLHEVLTRFDARDAAEEIRGFLKAAYPHFEDITVQSALGGTPARALVRIREVGMDRPMEIWDLSDGMLRFLCLAVALLSPTFSTLIAIDEPEVGLHPKLLPILGDMIKTASEKTQVLITTHSPELLNCFALDNIVVMRREDSRATWDRPGTSQALKRMLESTLGGTVGDLHRSGELEGIVQ